MKIEVAMERLLLGNIFFGLVIFFSSCGENSSNQRTVEKIFFDSGKIHVEQEFLYDTIQDGFYKKYYENGKLEVEIPHKNNLRDGMAISYYDNGNVESKVNYENDYTNGKAIYYHLNGNISTECNYLHGAKVGDIYDYGNDNEIEKYAFAKNDGSILYIHHYLENDDFKREGKGIIDFHVSKNKIKLGDTVFVKIIVATPPKSILKFTLNEVSDVGEVRKKHNLNIDIQKNEILFELPVKSSEVIRLKGVYSITSESNSEYMDVYSVTFDDIVVD